MACTKQMPRNPNLERPTTAMGSVSPTREKSSPKADIKNIATKG